MKRFQNCYNLAAHWPTPGASLARLKKPSGLSRGAVDRVIKKIADFETEIVNSDQIYVAEELCRRFEGMIPDSVHFDILFRERRRFPPGRDDADPDWLFFPYLSFGFLKGRVSQFENHDAVHALMRARRADSRHILEEQNKYVLCVPASGSELTLRIARRCAKLIMAFYYACGTHDHFTDNIARRHVTAYLSEKYNRDPEKAVAYCQSAYGVQVAYAFQTGQETTYELVADPTGLMEELDEYEEFLDDVASSVRSKASRFGATKDGEWNYSIHTVLDEVAEPAPAKVISTENRQSRHSRRGCVIVASRRKRLPLDVIRMAPTLFRAHRAQTRAIAREDFFRALHASTWSLEDEFAAGPPESIEAFRGRVMSGLSEAVEQLVKQEIADWCQVLLVDPFSNSLSCTLTRSDEGAALLGAPSFSLTRDAAFPGVKAFKEDAVLHIPDLTSNETIRAGWEIINQPRTRSIFAAPLMAGKMKVGAIVVGSRWPQIFEPELPYLVSVTSAIGDFLHRSELVADISWLARISFMHAARHELENLRRHLDGEVGEQFERILRSYSGLHDLGGSTSGVTLEDVVKRCNGTKKNSAPIKVTGADAKRFRMNARDVGIVSSIINQLIVNARSHSEILNDPFQIQMRRSADGAVVSIKYKSKVGRIATEVLPRLCMSPIPDVNTQTYHYGLFLCAVQARMLGGRALVRQRVPSSFGKSPLELCFDIPVSGDRNESAPT